MISGRGVETLWRVEQVRGPGLMNRCLDVCCPVERLVEAHDCLVVDLAAGLHRSTGAERADQLLKRRCHDAGMRQRAVVHVVRRKLVELTQGPPRRR